MEVPNINSTRRRGRCSLERFRCSSKLSLISKFRAHSSGAGEFRVRCLVLENTVLRMKSYPKYVILWAVAVVLLMAVII
ncbi:MAG: hypothetical protein ACE5IW_11575, partial [bacterium]